MKTAKALGINKGDCVRMHSGFVGVVMGQANTCTPLCEVWGYEREMGSVYSSDITKITPHELVASDCFKTNPTANSKEGKEAIEASKRPAETPKPKKKPTLEQLENWMMEGVSEATDGCRVEPDGVCPHGCKSWIMELGLL